MELSNLTKALVNTLDKPKASSSSSDGDTISISRTVSVLAVLYEKVRTAIEYREEHLLRRAAIERIIKRRLILNDNGRGIAEYLVKEILWAKYMPEHSISTYQIEDVQITIDKYLYLKRKLSNNRTPKEKSKLFEWLISIAAAEVEEKLSKNPQRDAFINFIYQYYKDKVFLLDDTDQTKDIQVYIGIHRAFAKSDDDYIRYNLLKLSNPELVSQTWKDYQTDTKKLYALFKKIDEYLYHPISQKMARALRKEMAPFLIIRDIYEKDPSSFHNILKNENELEEVIKKTCQKRYHEVRQRRGRAGTRSIIYIFITKMVFALGIEYPFERYILGDLNLMALGINTVFPPFLMLLALVGSRPPGDENTNRIVKRIKEIVYKDIDRNHKITLAIRSYKRRPVLTFAFTLLYIFAFGLVFGSIVWFLEYLHFSIISKLIFIFFVTVIMFFAYRIRQTGREYMLAYQESLFSPVANFLLLPVLNVGKLLSNEVARLNFFVALFDYLIEAPFKAIFELFEEWFSFMRKQKEEIL